MGSTFSNISILKKIGFDNDTIKNKIADYMCGKGYYTANPENAEIKVIVKANEKSKWLTVYSDAFDMIEYDELLANANSLSKTFDNYTIASFCFDSDILLLGLVNDKKSVEDVAIVGKELLPDDEEIPESNPENWKPILSEGCNLFDFKEILESEYTFAEEKILLLEKCFGFLYEDINVYLSEMDEEEFEYCFYFSQNKLSFGEPYIKEGKTELRRLSFHLGPCEMDSIFMLSYCNYGGPSKGLDVYILGPFIENEEVIFDDIQLCENKKPGINSNVVLTSKFERIKLKNGEWAYRAEFPDFKIPKGVNKKYFESKSRGLSKAEENSEFYMRIKPHGNKKYELDIVVIVIPKENRDNQTIYYPWISYDSKKDFIVERNKEIIERSEELGFSFSELIDESLYLYDEN